jgi:hypothetical protein
LRISGEAEHTLGKTGTQQTGDLLDQSVGSDKGIVLASQLLDQLLVLVELLQVVGAHGVDTAVLGTVDIVLVTENADAHVRAGDGGQLDSARKTYALSVSSLAVGEAFQLHLRCSVDVRLSRWGS